MRAGIYIFEYRSQLDRAKCWKRVHCETMEDINEAIKMIGRSFGEVVEYDRELTNEEWYERKRLFEEQEQNEA